MDDDQREPAPSKDPAHPAARMILGDALFRYCPLWKSGGNDVFCYLCEPFWDVGTGEPLPEAALQQEFDDPKRLLALDIETLHKATAQIEEVVAQYGLMTVLIPVHFETLANPDSAETYIQQCDKHVWPVMDSVYFEIVNPPAPPFGDALAAVAARVMPYGCGVMLRVERGFDRFDQIPAGDIFSVGMDFRADRRDEQEILADLKTFASDSGSHGLCRHVHGLKTVTLGMAAVGAGFDFVGSDAIAPPLEKWTQDEESMKTLELFKSVLAAAKGDTGS